MFFPSLPTDSIYKTLAFIGVLIVVYTSIYLTKDRTDIIGEKNKIIEELQANIIERDSLYRLYSDTKKQIDSLEVHEKITEDSAKIFYAKGNEKLYTDITEKRIALLEKSKDKTKSLIIISQKISGTKKESDVLYKQYEIKEKEASNYKLEIWFLSVSGLFFFIFGYFRWYRIQQIQDSILKNQHLRDFGYELCQSCGMQLKYAKVKTNKYCGFCFSNGEFVHHDIKLENFEKIVKERLKILGFSGFYISRHIRDIKKLERWKKKFTWE